MEVGELIIKTAVNSKGVDKGIAEVERKLEQLDKKRVRVFEQNGAGGTTTIVKDLTDEEKKYEERLQATLQSLYEKKQALENVKEIESQVTHENVDQSNNLYRLVDGVMTTADGKRYILKTDEDITQEEKEQNEETRKHIANIDKVGKGLQRVVKKVAKWSLAVFGIRGAYMAIRNAINTISQEDEQLKADIDYMKTAIAFILEPVVRKVVEWAKLLVFYIGYLIKQWTGHDIFKSANKNLQKSVGSAKELNKQLAGFDEMNILSDSSSGGSSTASGPSFNFEDMETPKWLETIRDIGQWIIDNWQDVVFGLLLTKLFIDLLTGNWLGVVIDLLGLLVIGFIKLKDAIKVIIESVKEIWGIFVDWITEKWNNFTTWISETINKIGDFFKNLWQGIKDGFKTAIDWVVDKFNGMIDFFSKLISKIVTLFKNIGTKVGNAIGGAFKVVINGVLKAVENILNFPIESINKLLDVINKVPGINISTLPTFNLPRLAKGGIINQPGRGVPLGGGLARGGEVAPEGVIPLTDSQQMALLGEAIGKYININATVPVYVGNRMVAREIKRINAEDNFAYNR